MRTLRENTIILLLALNLLPGCGKTPEPVQTSDAAQAVSELERVQIGGVDQWLLIRGDNRRNPVLLIVHGGPGAGTIGFSRHFYAELEKTFVVVNWDQRGAGKSFSLFMPDVTPETYVADTAEVVMHLKQKLNVPKVFLMGHSWGGYVAAVFAHRRPGVLYAYVGVGPVVKGDESAKISFDYILEQARKNPETAGEAGELTMETYLENRRRWLNAFGVGLFHGAHRADEDKYLRGLMYDSPDYSVGDMITYLPGIWRSSSRLRPHFFQMNLFEQAPSIDVPVFFFQGRFDYYNPGAILERYLSVLAAPKKTIVWFECCAHAPHFEAPLEFAAQMNAMRASIVR